jgi:DNA-binding response OmpR family regulator
MSKILVVDDSEDLLNLLTVMLNIRGHEVATSYSISDTIKKVNLFSPDLIMIDVLLGNKSGKDLCKTIKKSKPGIPVILMSASPALLHDFREYKADDFIDKPFDITVLNRKIDALVAPAKIETYR